MSVTKRISGDYTLTTAPVWDANVTISTHTVYINGNLQVGGTSQSITQTNTDITDNIITLNKGETGPGVSLNYSGIQVDRGSAQFVPELRWSEPDGSWQITNDGSTYSNIASTAATFSLISDPNPTLGSDFNTQNWAIYSNIAPFHVHFDSNLALGYQTLDPAAPVSNYTLLYAKAPSGGASGLYSITTGGTTQELATKSAAIKYSIIFG